MSLFNRNKALVALSLGALAALGACGDDVTVPVAPAAPVVLTISPPSASMNIGESLNFAVQISGGSTTSAPTLASCTSSNTAVATAAVSGSACRVTAVASGNATITAAASTGQSAAAAVSVAAQAAAISGLTVSPASASIPVNQTVTIVPTVNRANNGVTVTYTYASSSASVATVSAGGVVTAVAPGVATITVTATGSGTGTASATLTSAATVTVTALPAGISAVSASPSAVNLGTGKTAQVVASATQPAGAPAATYTYASSATAVATVSATGLITAVAPGTAVITVTGASAANSNFAAGSGSAAVTVTVSALPAGLTALTVTPSSLSLAVGASAQVTASAQGPTAGAAVITYGTTNPAVATVDAAGNVSAVAPGTATITATATSAATADYAASTLSSSVGITVAPRAQVAIAAVVDNAGAPVNINNVNGQIGVDVAITTNGQNVSAAQVYICAVGAAACPAAGQAPAAQQQFGAGGANDGSIRMLINTADFTVDWTTGVATVANTNGQKNVIATITTSSTGSANSNLAILNFNNGDGWAGRHVAPTRTIVATNGSAFFGGPGTDGQGTMTVAPVIYTAGRSVSAFAVNISGCGTNTAFTSADARPWTVTYGAFAAPTGKQANCAYQTLFAGAPDVTGSVNGGALDNNNLAYPAAAAGAFLTTTSNPTAVGQPATIRVDYVAPAGYTFNVNATATSVAGWVNGAYNFATNAANIGALADAGVGLVTTRNIEVRGCPIPAAATAGWTALSTNTGADLAECATDFGPTAYEARFTGADRLTNTGAAVVAAQRFGVDKTVPLVRYTATTDTNMTIYGSAAVPAVGAATDTVFSAQAIDERSGLLATGSLFAQARTTAAAAACLTGAPAAGIGTTPQTAPNCNFAAGGYGAATADGWRQLTGGALTLNGVIATADGYYTYIPRVIDQAGNITSGTIRYILAEYQAPLAVTPTALPLTTFPVTATSAISFAGTVTDGIEASISSFRLNYGAAGNFAFSASAIANTTFDNIIPGFGTATTGRSSIAGATPFTSGTLIYTGIESVDGADAIVAGGAQDALAGYGFFANNFGGGLGLANTAPIGGVVTPDANAWSVKAPNAATFVVSNSAAGFNAPAGGLKAQVTSTLAQINSPVSRVDFYITNAGGVNEYVGTVTPDCDPASATRNCYIADIGVVRTWTYRYTGALANSSTSTAARAYPAGATALRAVATLGSNGRALATRAGVNVTVAAP
jgi:uncharacterized protein YjdB